MQFRLFLEQVQRAGAVLPCTACSGLGGLGRGAGFYMSKGGERDVSEFGKTYSRPLYTLSISWSVEMILAHSAD
jgi:hypothetical protein